MTTVINLIGGPGVGKTVLACQVFASLKILGKKAEYVSEYAKDLVWQNRIIELDNQYEVSYQQFKKLYPLQGKVDFIVTDGSLFKDLYYNRFNKNNVSNVEKTENKILEWGSYFKNINFFLGRSKNSSYEQAGRIQSELEAKQIDKEIEKLLLLHAIPFYSIPVQSNCVEEIIELILKT
jgi:hypothetical protein